MTNNDQQQPYSRFDQLADSWLAGIDSPTGPMELTVEELLNRLVATPDGLALHHLFVLSDLSREQAALVRREWPSVPVDRRRTIVRQLIQLAEEDLTLQLGRLLRVALGDGDPDIRRMAIDGLWADADMESDLIGPLVSILQNDPDPRPCAAAARALGAYVLAGELEELDAALAMHAEEALLAIMHSDAEPFRVRSRALESLAYSSEIEIRQIIEDAYYSSDEEMRVSALIAMGRSADVRWRALVRAELQNPAAAMRAAAAQACGELEIKTAVDELTDLIADEDIDVKVAAILALGSIGGKAARDILEATRLSDDPVEVEAADNALEELMLFAGHEDELSSFDAQEEEDWDIEPWEHHRKYDDDDLGQYEE